MQLIRIDTIPSPSLSNKLNASLNSAICSSVKCSAMIPQLIAAPFKTPKKPDIHHYPFCLKSPSPYPLQNACQYDNSPKLKYKHIKDNAIQIFKHQPDPRKLESKSTKSLHQKKPSPLVAKTTPRACPTYLQTIQKTRSSGLREEPNEAQKHTTRRETL